MEITSWEYAIFAINLNLLFVILFRQIAPKQVCFHLQFRLCKMLSWGAFSFSSSIWSSGGRIELAGQGGRDGQSKAFLILGKSSSSQNSTSKGSSRVSQFANYFRDLRTPHCWNDSNCPNVADRQICSTLACSFP